MTTKEIKALISLLDDPEIAPQIQSEIQNLGETIIPYLEESWEESLDPQQQQRLEDLIHQLQFEGLQQRLRVWRDAGAQDLLEGMWLLNSYQYPDADLQALNRAIEQLLGSCGRTHSPADILQASPPVQIGASGSIISMRHQCRHLLPAFLLLVGALCKQTVTWTSACRRPRASLCRC